MYVLSEVEISNGTNWAGVWEKAVWVAIALPESSFEHMTDRLYIIVLSYTENHT